MHWILLARVVISWINADYHNPIVRFIYGVTEPVLDPVRRRLPVFAGGVRFFAVCGLACDHIFPAIYCFIAL